MKKYISPCPLQNKTCLYLITCARNKNTRPIYISYLKQNIAKVIGRNKLLHYSNFVGAVHHTYHFGLHFIITRILVKLVVKINYDEPLILKRILKLCTRINYSR